MQTPGSDHNANVTLTKKESIFSLFLKHVSLFERKPTLTVILPVSSWLTRRSFQHLRETFSSFCRHISLIKTAHAPARA